MLNSLSVKGKRSSLDASDATLFRKGNGFRVDEVDLGTIAVGEDVLAVKAECMNAKGKPQRLLVIVMHMTVESERAVRENKENYYVLRKVVREHTGEKNY